MQFATYDLRNRPPSAPAGLLTVLWLAPTPPTAFVGVPQSVANAFQVSNSQLTFYNTRILPAYHELLMALSTNCPLTGVGDVAIWTK